MRWFFLIPFILTSCGSEPISQPFLAKPLKAKNKKIFAGRLTFSGLSEEELSAFRVIPEKGKALIQPENRHYPQVDGFWWKGAEKGEWFKIPGSSAAWIGKGEAPFKFTELVEQNGLQVHIRSNVLVKFVGAVGNGVRKPGWVKDEGETKSPVPSPWAVLVE